MLVNEIVGVNGFPDYFVLNPISLDNVVDLVRSNVGGVVEVDVVGPDQRVIELSIRGHIVSFCDDGRDYVIVWSHDAAGQAETKRVIEFLEPVMHL
jgi:hypothetical protein